MACFHRGILLLATGSLLFHFANPLDPDAEEKINAFAEKLLTCRDILGLNLAVVKDDVTVFTNGYGVLDLEKQQPVTSKSIFGIASLTKAFTATLLGQVLKDKGYSWSTKVRDVLGEDFYFFDGLRTSQVTMQDLAAHTLGIPNHNYARFEGLSRRDAAYKLRFFEPTATFRSSFTYNNAIYGLMAYITETVSGKSWEDTLQEYIFNPAGMSSSTFSHFVNHSREDLALPYMIDSETQDMRRVALEFHSFWGKSGGSGAVMSNAEDMAQWLKLQLANGKVDGKEVISEEVIKETHDTVNRILQSSVDPYKKPTIPVSYAQTGYGLGWRLGWYRGNYMILHTGTSWGYGALLTLLPDVSIGIYSSITGPDSGYVGRRMLHMYVMDLLLGETPWLNLTTACTFPEPWSPVKERANKVPPRRNADLNADLYEGTYGSFLYGNITFATNQSTSELTLYFGDFGRWILAPTETEHEFKGLGSEIMWASSVDSIKFSDMNGGHFNKVVVAFDRTAPSEFARGRSMAEAPPPPNPDECGSTSTNSAPHLLRPMYLFFACFMVYLMK